MSLKTLSLLMVLVTLFAPALRAAPTLSVTPASVTNTFTGQIFFQITGIDPAETVPIERFIDSNANGSLDATDVLVGSFTVTDGLIPSLGRSRIYSLPADEDLLANGQIKTALTFEGENETSRAVGSFLYRVNARSGTFVKSFLVTGANLGQKVNGVVTANGQAAAGALIILLRPTADGDEDFVASAISDAQGRYSIPAAPGSYSLLAFKKDFVSTFPGSQVKLSQGQDATVNSTMSAGSRTIAGRVFDSVSSAKGIAGLQIFAGSEAGQAAIIYTDVAGNFSTLVPPGDWFLQFGDPGVSKIGYIGLNTDVQANTQSGNATGLAVLYVKGTALLNGTISDSAGKGLPGVLLVASDSAGAYEVKTVSDTNGNFGVLVKPGTWGVHAGRENAWLNSKIASQVQGLTMAAGQTTRADLEVRAATGRINGTVRDANSSAGVAEIAVFAQAVIGGKTFYTEDVLTDQSGSYSLPVPDGLWSIGVQHFSLEEKGYTDATSATAFVTGTTAAPQPIVLSRQGGFPLTLQVNSPQTATAGQFFATGLDVQGGGPPYNISLAPSSGPLPPGLAFNTAGAFSLSGTPTVPGSFGFVIRVSDGSGKTADAPLFVTVLPGNTAPGDVRLVYLSKRVNYTQTSTGTPALSPDSPYTFEAGVDPQTAGSVLSGLIRVPSAQIRSLISEGQSFSTKTNFATSALMDLTFGAGTYLYSVSTKNEGTKAFSASLPLSTFPAAPHISNFSEAQNIASGASFELKWDSLGGTVDDLVFVRITDQTNRTVYGSVAPGENGALDGLSRSLFVPANALDAGKTYKVELYYYKSLTTSSGSGGSVRVFSGYGAQTLLSIATKTAQDLTPPQLISVTPANGTPNVATNAVVTFTFTEPMQPGFSVNWTPNVRAEAFVGTWSPDQKTLSLTYQPGFPPDASISWTLDPTGNFRDLAGNPLQNGASGVFTTTGAGIPLRLKVEFFAFSGGAFQFNVSGPPSVTATVETSTDLKTWVFLTNRVVAAPPAGAFVGDKISAPGPRRFYRARY